MAVIAVTGTFAADVGWPADFDAKLAEHIAAEKSTNTTVVACSMQVDACYRTSGLCELAVTRKPFSGFQIIFR